MNAEALTPSIGGGAVVPVILCGGAGTRLWPASTTARPKPFAVLVGERSGFQDALARGLAVGSGAPALVIGAATDRPVIDAQARRIGAPVQVVLEPGGRSSGPALAAAAVWLAASDPDAILVALSADHHVDNRAAFTADIVLAVEAARTGAVVTLGAKPTEPSTAFGYIRTGEAAAPVKPVLAFVEKPDAERAAAYVAEGCLWNTGMFVVAASTLITELERYAPDVLAAARAGVEQSTEEAGAVLLGQGFLGAPTISIDHAVMEKTTLAKVVPARFGWADLGAWDAVLAASTRDEDGNCAPPDAVLVDARNVLARAPAGVRLGVVGLDNVAVVAEPGAVLVCALDRTQDVKVVAERMAATPPTIFADLGEARVAFDRWMRTSALPLWWTVGADHQAGGFHERLTLEGRPTVEPRRMLVQARQAFAFAMAGRSGWSGPWRDAILHGLTYIDDHYRLDDGLYGAAFTPADGSRSEAARTYDQAFALLAWAAAREAGVRADAVTGPGARARRSRSRRGRPRSASSKRSARSPSRPTPTCICSRRRSLGRGLDPETWGASGGSDRRLRAGAVLRSRRRRPARVLRRGLDAGAG